MAERMAEALGGGAVLGPGVRGWGDLAGRARGGIPWGALEALSERLGTGIADLAGVLRIPARTLARRRKAGFFDADESDRSLRVARGAAIAGEVMGDAGRAARAALDGEGARIHGGRWNLPGSRVVYASATLSLAVLEMLVHAGRECLPVDLVSGATAVLSVPSAVIPGELDYLLDPAHADFGRVRARRARPLALDVRL